MDDQRTDSEDEKLNRRPRIRRQHRYVALGIATWLMIGLGIALCSAISEGWSLFSLASIAVLGWGIVSMLMYAGRSCVDGSIPREE